MSFQFNLESQFYQSEKGESCLRLQAANTRIETDRLCKNVLFEYEDVKTAVKVVNSLSALTTSLETYGPQDATLALFNGTDGALCRFLGVDELPTAEQWEEHGYTEIVMEGLGDTIKKGIDAIIKFFKNLIKKIGQVLGLVKKGAKAVTKSTKKRSSEVSATLSHYKSAGSPPLEDILANKTVVMPQAAETIPSFENSMKLTGVETALNLKMTEIGDEVIEPWLSIVDAEDTLDDVLYKVPDSKQNSESPDIDSLKSLESRIMGDDRVLEDVKLMYNSPAVAFKTYPMTEIFREGFETADELTRQSELVVQEAVKVSDKCETIGTRISDRVEEIGKKKDTYVNMYGEDTVRIILNILSRAGKLVSSLMEVHRARIDAAHRVSDAYLKAVNQFITAIEADISEE